jgi:hypothetical protein
MSLFDWCIFGGLIVIEVVIVVQIANALREP